MTTFDAARAAYFDKLAPQWDAMAKEPGAPMVARVIEKLGISPHSSILDVGSGTGSLLRYLLQTEPKLVIACDLSQNMLDVIADKYPGEPRLQLLQADAAALPLADGSVDVVICNGVYPHFADKLATLRELWRVLVSGGCLAISHFVGRDFVNKIHSSSPSPLIQADLLAPAADVADLMAIAGFLPGVCVDKADLFLVTGTKP